ncbi:MAG TPA: DUF1302 family protein [Methylibium sp.]|nr:DUF1302 family protein [Methylibium sp.]
MRFAHRPIRTALAVLGATLGGAHALAADGNDDGYSLSVGGYVRGWAAFNLQDQPETPSDDKWKPSMLRGSVLLDADARTGPVQWKGIVRVDHEAKTGYLVDLERLRAGNGTTGGDYKSITDNYNAAELREFWGEMKLGERTSVRAGKQQIVWGESDFFQAMDLVHGYDLSWRLFLEGENEEWRKPLWLISTKIDVPEAQGQIQAFVRPGGDRCKDIGNTYDIRGGRWFFNPYRGFDLSAITSYDCDHPEGDKGDWTGGVRWAGEAGPVSYSVAYVKTYAADPVANSSLAPWKKAPKGPLFDLVHPKIDVLGATVSGYSAATDTVFSAELAYTFGQPFNVGTGPALGLLGIKRKDTVRMMLRADKNLNFQNWLGTTRPSFSSVQLFDTWIPSHDRSEDLVRLFAYGSPTPKHNPLLTAFTVLNYASDTINPSFAVGIDKHGGGFFIPAVDLVLGDHWRAKVEAAVFWNKDHGDALFDPNDEVQLFGWFHKSSQLTFRLTRQF